MITKIYVVLLGIVLGSFLNTCIYRIPQKQSIISPASCCTSCNAGLNAIDLIPIASYVILMGKCKYCGDKIGVRYILIEILTGIIALVLFLKWGLNIKFILYGIFACLLICIFFIDYDYLIIPDGLIYLGILYGVVCKLILYKNENLRLAFINGILGFVLGGFIFLLLAIITRDGIGGGDIKLVSMLGFYFGWQNIILIALISFLIGGLIASFLLVTGVKNLKDPIPFAPFLILSSLIIFLYKDLILYWYIKGAILY